MRITLTATIILTLSLIISAKAAVIYTDTFNTDGSTYGVGYSGWDWAYSTSGTDGNENAQGASGNFGVNRAPTNFNGYIGYYFLNTDTARPNPVFVYADNTHTVYFTPYNYSDITSIQFDLKNDANVNLRLALKIDGSWFISTTQYTNATSGVSQSFGIDPFTDTNWSTLNFSLGSSLTIGSSTSLPSSGSIQGIGFYDPAPAVTRMSRIEQVTINAIPEPASALLGSLGLLLLFGRRR